MDKLTNKLNDISIEPKSSTPRLLRNGKNRNATNSAKAGPKTTSFATSSSTSYSSASASNSNSRSNSVSYSQSTSISTTCDSSTETASNTKSTSSSNSNNSYASSSAKSTAYSTSNSPPKSPPYSDLSDSDIYFDEDDLEETFIYKPPNVEGHKELILTTTKFGKIFIFIFKIIFKFNS